MPPLPVRLISSYAPRRVLSNPAMLDDSSSLRRKQCSQLLFYRRCPCLIVELFEPSCPGVLKWVNAATTSAYSSMSRRMLTSMGWSVSSSRCLETTTECFDQVLEIPHLFLAAGTPPPRCACHVRRRNKVRLFCNLSATITYSAATDAASTCLR